MEKSIYIILAAVAISCLGCRERCKVPIPCAGKTEVHENDISNIVKSLQAIDYGEFRGSSFEFRHGLFRSVVGEIDNVRFVVGLYGRNNEFRNDAKHYPLPDSLRNSENIYEEIAKRSFPLSRRELSLVHDFIKTDLLELTVDMAGNVRGKVSPQIKFEISNSPECVQELLQDGYVEYENKYYIKKNE